MSKTFYEISAGVIGGIVILIPIYLIILLELA